MKNLKIITYDLCNSGKNYEALYKYIRSYTVWAQITESTWLVSTTKSCSTIYNEIDILIDSDDKLFIAELTGTATWGNVLCDSDYLKKSLQGYV